jgi:hypothetical protein
MQQIICVVLTSKCSVAILMGKLTDMMRKTVILAFVMISRLVSVRPTSSSGLTFSVEKINDLEEILSKIQDTKILYHLMKQKK